MIINYYMESPLILNEFEEAFKAAGTAGRFQLISILLITLPGSFFVDILYFGLPFFIKELDYECLIN